jgi:hypothetical protein
MKNNYPSSYTDRKISASQYLAERMCERIAKKEGKGDLPYKFWNVPVYKKFFLYQVNIANALLKLYSIEAILAALKKLPMVYSLNAEFIDNTIKREQKIIDKQQAELANKTIEDKNINTTEKPRQAFTEKKSAISKLREM